MLLPMKMARSRRRRAWTRTRGSRPIKVIHAQLTIRRPGTSVPAATRTSTSRSGGGDEVASFLS